ncbi:DNA polymerase III subunit beta [Saccharibacillus sacchari]|uniref:DNA polymerase III subunit beta n=1 Tax=Saccharibacillus sacchari TaxID=456493 RepID=A0ACC6PDX7_9BACL
MLIEIAKSSLIYAVQNVVKALSSNPAQPASAAIRIRADLNGVTLTASGASMKIRIVLPRDDTSANVRQAGSIAVSAHHFYRTIRRLEEGTVTLEVREPLMLTIASSRFRMRLCGIGDAEFDNNGLAKEAFSVRFRIDGTTFGSAIRQVAKAASLSENRPILTGLLLECDQAKLRLTATDGIRLASRSLDIETLEGGGSQAIVPAKTLNEIAKMLKQAGKAVEVELSRNRATFVADRLHIEANLLSGNFPSVKSVDSASGLCEFKVDRAEWLQALERVTIVAEDQIVRLAADRTRLHLSSKAPAIGEVEHEVPLQAMVGGSFVLSLNGKLLTDIVRGSDCAFFRITYTGPMTPLVIRPDDLSESSLFLITSVRTQESWRREER